MFFLLKISKKMWYSVILTLHIYNLTVQEFLKKKWFFNLTLSLFLSLSDSSILNLFSSHLTLSPLFLSRWDFFLSQDLLWVAVVSDWLWVAWNVALISDRTVRLLSLSRSTLGGCGFRLALGGLKRGHGFRSAWPWVSDRVSSYGFPVGVGSWGCGWRLACHVRRES